LGRPSSLIELPVPDVQHARRAPRYRRVSMKSSLVQALPFVLLACLIGEPRPTVAQKSPGGEEQFLSNTRQLTFAGKRSGEGYFSSDGKTLIFQSEREPDNPFYQIYLLD